MTADSIEERLTRLEVAVVALTAEVRTRRLVIVDDEGEERITADVSPDTGQAQIAADQAFFEGAVVVDPLYEPRERGDLCWQSAHFGSLAAPAD